MKLRRREKILTTAAGGLAALLTVWLLLFSGGGLSYSQLSARRDRLALEVAKKESDVKRAAAAARRMSQWQRHALPSDVAEARMHYQAWLRELAERLQFQHPNVESRGVESRPRVFSLLKYSVRGRTNLAKLTEFLGAFYSAGHLHQIRLIDVTAVPNTTDLDVNIEVEAMSLPGADRKTKLTEARGETLDRAKLPDYTKAIVGRNLFGPFQPPAGPPPDIAASTFVTAILAVDGQGEVWLVDRASGTYWKAHVGEPIEIGSVNGTIKGIGAHDVTILVGGRLRRYRAGETLRGGEEVRTP